MWQVVLVNWDLLPRVQWPVSQASIPAVALHIVCNVKQGFISLVTSSLLVPSVQPVKFPLKGVPVVSYALLGLICMIPVRLAIPSAQVVPEGNTHHLLDPRPVKLFKRAVMVAPELPACARLHVQPVYILGLGVSIAVIVHQVRSSRVWGRRVAPRVHRDSIPSAQDMPLVCLAHRVNIRAPPPQHLVRIVQLGNTLPMVLACAVRRVNTTPRLRPVHAPRSMQVHIESWLLCSSYESVCRLLLSLDGHLPDIGLQSSLCCWHLFSNPSIYILPKCGLRVIRSIHWVHFRDDLSGGDVQLGRGISMYDMSIWSGQSAGRM
jgi:hypothetical protein